VERQCVGGRVARDEMGPEKWMKARACLDRQLLMHEASTHKQTTSRSIHKTTSDMHVDA
jgi:hypothetical protein